MAEFLAERALDQTTDRLGGQETPPPARPLPQGPKEAEALPRPFGRYELQRLLGRGAMGSVYLAHDPQLDRLVALKIPRPLDEDLTAWRERFLSEARAAATLHHPNICPVFEVGEAQGSFPGPGAQPYLTMAYIEGETLAAHLRRAGSLAVTEAVELIRTISQAMAEAHERGIVHRDLKPANIMIDRRGQPVIMDFGLALRATGGDDLRLTLSGVALGTPCYMPPEQAGGDHDAIGPPADVYSLGVILYELVTGRVPFEGRTFGKLLAQIERDPPPPPQTIKSEVDERLANVILRALAKQPADRFASAAALGDALSRYAQGLPEPAGICGRGNNAETTAWQPAAAAQSTASRWPRRRWLIAGGALAAGVSLAAIVGGLALTANQPQAPPAKPVAYPAQATLIEIPGWQLLTDATQEQMQTWLDERKATKHSVMWLDVVQIGEKPVFTAVATLDDRASDWEAFLDLTAEEVNDTETLAKNRFNGVLEGWEAVTISGFVRGKTLWGVELFRRGNRIGRGGVVGLSDVSGHVTKWSPNGYVVRFVRPFTTPGGVALTGLYLEQEIDTSSRHATDLSEADFLALLEKQRKEGTCPEGVVPFEVAGKRQFAVAFRDDPTKAPWEVVYDLTAAELEAKSAELADKGMTPVSINVYPHDGEVRYSVVWRKDSRQEP